MLGCNALVRQTGWGQEEAKPSHHLAAGQQFDITILCDPMVFKVNFFIVISNLHHRI